MRWVMSGGTFVGKRRRSDVMSSSLSTSTTCPMAAKAGTTTCSRDIQQKSAILRRGAHNLNLKSVNARGHAYSRQCGLTINRTGKQGQSVVVCVKPPAWEGQCSLTLIFLRLRFLLYNYLPALKNSLDKSFPFTRPCDKYSGRADDGADRRGSVRAGRTVSRDIYMLM